MKSAVSPVCSGGYIETHFTPCSSVSIVNFGQYCYRNVNIKKDIRNVTIIITFIALENDIDLNVI